MAPFSALPPKMALFSALPPKMALFSCVVTFFDKSHSRPYRESKHATDRVAYTPPNDCDTTMNRVIGAINGATASINRVNPAIKGGATSVLARRSDPPFRPLGQTHDGWGVVSRPGHVR
eukprot:1768995-Rhodomonas_salina.1